jgi:hypothetical protein
VAEGVGFEPTVQMPGLRFSRPNSVEIRGPSKPLSGAGIPRGERGIGTFLGLHLVAWSVTGRRGMGYKNGDTACITSHTPGGCRQAGGRLGDPHV